MTTKLIDVTLKLKRVICLIMALGIILLVTPFASIIAAKLYENDNRAFEFFMNFCDNLLYLYNNYGCMMHNLHGHRLGMVSMNFGFKDYQYFIDFDLQRLNLCE